MMSLSDTQQALHPAEVMPRELYQQVRPQFLQGMVELKRRRRVALEPYATLVFENRDTVLFQIQEVLRIAPDASPARVRRQIDEYDPLVPRADELRATLMFDGQPGDQSASRALQIGRAGALSLRVGDAEIQAQPLEDEREVAHPVQFLRFALTREIARALDDPESAAALHLRARDHIASAPLAPETRSELLQDLQPCAGVARLAAVQRREVHPQRGEHGATAQGTSCGVRIPGRGTGPGSTHAGRAPCWPEIVRSGAITVDLLGYRAWVDAHEVHLTPAEFRLLRELLGHPGQVRSRRELLRDAWDIRGNVVTRTVDTHVTRLRAKLGRAGSSIECVRGAGYRYTQVRDLARIGPPARLADPPAQVAAASFRRPARTRSRPA
ncbi:MAG: DUF3501 family protein [Proteobacteria bacterium]|nr:DUF3501 family protein [Pseudomonadota bacterium]